MWWEWIDAPKYAEPQRPPHFRGSALHSAATPANATMKGVRSQNFQTIPILLMYYWRSLFMKFDNTMVSCTTPGFVWICQKKIGSDNVPVTAISISVLCLSQIDSAKPCRGHGTEAPWNSRSFLNLIQLRSSVSATLKCCHRLTMLVGLGLKPNTSYIKCHESIHLLWSSQIICACSPDVSAPCLSPFASRSKKQLFRSSKHSVTDFVPTPSTQSRYCLGSIEGTGRWWRINLSKGNSTVFQAKLFGNDMSRLFSDYFGHCLCPLSCCCFSFGWCHDVLFEIMELSWQFLRQHTIQGLASARDLTSIQLEVQPQKPCKLVTLSQKRHKSPGAAHCRACCCGRSGPDNNSKFVWEVRGKGEGVKEYERVVSKGPDWMTFRICVVGTTPTGERFHCIQFMVQTFKHVFSRFPCSKFPSPLLKPPWTPRHQTSSNSVPLFPRSHHLPQGNPWQKYEQDQTVW